MNGERKLRAFRAAWAARPAAPPAGWNRGVPQWWGFPAREWQAGMDELYAHGEVVWGWLLMANHALYANGPDDAPGEVLWSDEPYVQRFPGVLSVAAKRYWALKQHDSVVPGLRSLSAFARDEYRSPAVRPFPDLFSEGRVLWHAVVLFHRSDLPHARLGDRLLPLLRLPGPPRMPVRILPVSWWSAEAAAEWTDPT